MDSLKNILFIAPADSGLDVVPEIDALYEYGYVVQSVQGEVIRKRLFDIMRNKRFDIVHFACHAKPDGVILSHDEYLDTPSIVQFVKSCGATLVFLNACETAEIGQMLCDEDVPAIICTLRRVEDQVAKETAQVFYKMLARGHDIRQAFHDSRPPVKGGYSLFTDGALNTIQMGPVLTRLEELTAAVQNSAEVRTAVVAKNDAEHAEFNARIDGLLQACGAQERQRRFFLRVSIATVVISLILHTLITLIGRGL